jgi:MFS family permease
MSRDLIMVAASLFTWGVGEGMFIYFQSLYLEKWGADPLQIGAILGGMGIAMTVAQAPAGYLADRVGSRPVMWASWILGCLAAGIMALAGSLAIFVTGMMVYGLTSFVVAPMNSYITSVRGRLSVERALTFVSAMFHMGAVIGPLMGGLVAEAYGLGVVYRIAAVIFVFSTILILIARRPPVEEHIESIKTQTPNLMKNPRFAGLLVMIFLTMFALYLPQPLAPNFLTHVHGLTLSDIGQLGSMNSLGNAVLLLVLGSLKAPVGFLVGQVLVALFALIMWQATHMIWFSAGYFFLGGYRLSRQMALAYARSLIKARETGFAYGLVETGNAVAVILAPPAAGLLYTFYPQGIFIAALAVIGAVILANLVLLPRGKQEEPNSPPEPLPAAAQE